MLCGYIYLTFVLRISLYYSEVYIYEFSWFSFNCKYCCLLALSGSYSLFQPSFTLEQSTIDASPSRKTKIVCTIGPSSSSREMIWKLAEAGMNVARLNMSHGNHASHKKTIDLVKEYNAQFEEKVIAIMLDTKVHCYLNTRAITFFIFILNPDLIVSLFSWLKFHLFL